MLDQANISSPSEAHLGLTPKHRLLQSAEDCADEESLALAELESLAGTNSLSQAAVSRVDTVSLHKTDGTSGQKGEGHKITHHSSVTRKSLTGERQFCFPISS